MSNPNTPQPETAKTTAREGTALRQPCSAFVVERFPKPCRPRKRHRCHLCWQRIEVGEECCRVTGLEPGEGYWTVHMHPECFDRTRYWDDGDWESHCRGDVERPPIPMAWYYEPRSEIGACPGRSS